jgi:dihydroorotase
MAESDRASLSLKPLIITGGHIIDPNQQWDAPGSLLVENGAVEWLGTEDEILPEGDFEKLNVPGMIVCPGFIDFHCHLREPGFEEKETIDTGTKAAARGGFTTVCCMPNTNPPIDTAAMIKYIRKKAAEESMIRVLPIACVTHRRQGNTLVSLTRLAVAGAVGFSDDGSPVGRTDLMRRALEICHAPGIPVIDHCEDIALSNGGVINEGKISVQFGLRGIPDAAEEKMVARDLELAKETGGRLHLAHLSTAGSVGLVRRAKEAGVQVTCEVTPHHLTLTEEEVILHGANAKVSPPLRTEKDIAALIVGLYDDVIDIIATDHAPHTEADKRGGLVDSAFGISGFETALGSLMRLVHSGKLPLDKMISKLTSGPAKLLGSKFGRLGTLAIGAPADITIFDPQKEWLVDPTRFASKGRNTPFAGTVLKGKVMATIVKGSVVYRDKSLGLVH